MCGSSLLPEPGSVIGQSSGLQSPVPPAPFPGPWCGTPGDSAYRTPLSYPGSWAAWVGKRSLSGKDAPSVLSWERTQDWRADAGKRGNPIIINSGPWSFQTASKVAGPTGWGYPYRAGPSANHTPSKARVLGRTLLELRPQHWKRICSHAPWGLGQIAYCLWASAL